jgi:hypothetical protein
MMKESKLSEEEAQRHFAELVRTRKMSVANNLALLARQSLSTKLLTLGGIENEIKIIRAKRSLSVKEITILAELETQLHFIEKMLRIPRKISKVNKRIRDLEEKGDKMTFNERLIVSGLKAYARDLMERQKNREAKFRL